MLDDTNQHPFLALRASIRDATRQYRHNSDTSGSLFHPAQGFVFAYDLAEVEDALNEYETTLPVSFINPAEEMTQEDRLIQMGARLVATCNDEGIREFAQEAVAYLIGAQMEAKGELFEFIQKDALPARPVVLGDLDPSISESG